MKKWMAAFMLGLIPFKVASANEIYVGAALSIGNQVLGNSDGTNSHFTTNGVLLEGGIDFEFAEIGAEVGSARLTNKLSDQTNIETAELGFYTAKAGLKFDRFIFGAGYRFNEEKFKSVSTDTGYLQSTYEGGTPLGYLGVELVAAKGVRVVIDAQYVSGSLKSNLANLPAIDFRETTLNLRLQLIPR